MRLSDFIRVGGAVEPIVEPNSCQPYAQAQPHAIKSPLIEWHLDKLYDRIHLMSFEDSQAHSGPASFAVLFRSSLQHIEAVSRTV